MYYILYAQKKERERAILPYLPYFTLRRNLYTRIHIDVIIVLIIAIIIVTLLRILLVTRSDIIMRLV